MPTIGSSHKQHRLPAVVNIFSLQPHLNFLSINISNVKTSVDNICVVLVFREDVDWSPPILLA